MKQAGSVRIAVYAGTFDPITYGHLDVLARACSLFETVVVAVAKGDKPGLLFPVQDRVDMVQDSVANLQANVRVEQFDGLLVDFMTAIGARVVVRGLRAVSDYEYEAQIAMTNRRLSSEIETIFLVASESCSFLSSSIVRNVAKYGGDLTSFVPENVAKRLHCAYPVPVTGNSSG